MLNKNIYDPEGKRQLENQFNRIIYAYLSKGSNIALPDNYDTYVNKGYAGNVNIYPIIRKIVNPAVGVKWNIVDDKGEVIEETKSDLYKLLKQPNPRQSFNEFIDEMMCWRLITGNSYIYTIYIETGEYKGKPAEIWTMPASQAEIVSGGMFEPVRGYKFLIGNTTIELPAENVIHGKYTSLNYDSLGSQLYGMSPLQAALKVMTATNAGYDQMAKQFENGGPDIIITNTSETAKQEWTSEQFETIWQKFKEKFRKGSRERYMLKNLPVEVHEIGKSLVDMNILEYMKLSLRDYCNIYGVPSALMNDNQYATQSANAREYQRQLWNNAVIPELERAKDDLNKIAARHSSATGTPQFFNYDISDIPELQADNTLMSQSLSTAWWLTPNQRLQAMGLPVSENPLMDQIYMPMGVLPIDEVANPDSMIDEANKALDKNNTKY